MEEIFRDPHPEGQTNTASPEDVEGEGLELEVTVAEEVVMDRGREEA